ncbi:MAG: signal recognition particle-docking protein FtsY [Aigarchaeota archaeon]|nr:signal recognition particle-docking protein FtsY [Aigarchaeota archaeon]MDW8092991.1 signal recognition particle-docking protein FtsY [Nitrososphaerota archaeon]
MLDGLRRAFRNLSERLTTRQLSDEEIDEVIEEFKWQLVSNDVALLAAEGLASEIKEKLSMVKVPLFGNRGEVLKPIFREALSSVLLETDEEQFISKVRAAGHDTEPFKLLFVGPNGGGKTTTVVKVAKRLKREGIPSLIACSDTFRAAAIEQLKRLAETIGVRTVSQKYGSDPAAVAIDAVNSARSNRIPLVLIDTAGRTEVDTNLLEEMRKIKRVVSPDTVIFVGDVLTGNAMVEQATKFNEYVGVDYAILTKLDADVRGGATVSLCFAVKRPILFLGVGQGLDDIVSFKKSEFIHRLLSD